ncbi:two-component system sporulation sensor kinase A [Oikeobacillus pervagus]|uniref:histidine kinase n=1 Tax=Oikeobacillus pervagus TaxID=1325931 RepID=A0AAJ1T0P6_9BACI|nr:ATP-binding protein [Oikeobacillus pervagus]MDQ0214642.1 two-component system sporulation sensor kinase A [Oikeobacillus pervagus]
MNNFFRKRLTKRNYRMFQLLFLLFMVTFASFIMEELHYYSATPIHITMFLISFLTAVVIKIMNGKQVMIYVLLGVATFFLNIGILQSTAPFFAMTLFAFPLLIVYGFLLPNPIWTILLGMDFIFISLSYYGKTDLQYINTVVIGLIVNTIIFAGFIFAMKQLKNQNSQLRLSESSLIKILNIFPKPIVIHHNDRILYLNKEMMNLLDIQEDDQEILRQSIYRFIHPEQHDLMQKKLSEVYKGNSTRKYEEVKMISKHGRQVLLDMTSALTAMYGKKVFITVGKDITDSKQQTVALIQNSEKLALVGQMAAGIAHEIRNPLTSIKGFIQLLSKEMKEKQEIFRLLLSELDRINFVVNEFLVVAKPTAVEFKPHDINKILLDVNYLLETQAIMNNIEIQMNTASHLPLVNCGENQLKQVFINLIKNAIEATAFGGKITVTSGDVNDEEIYIKISDTGCGIPKDRLPNLGQPFHTTKEKGTGLGLMVCYSIIESHQGTMKIESQEGVGTTIIIHLPVSTPNQTSQMQAIKSIV